MTAVWFWWIILTRHGTAGYYGVLLGTWGYWVVLGCTEVYCRVWVAGGGGLPGTGGTGDIGGVIEDAGRYCDVLLGYCRIILGYSGVQWGTVGVLWGTGVYCGVLWGTGEKYGVFWNVMGYCRALLGTGVHLWVLVALGVLTGTGYWGGGAGTGGTME